MSIKRSRLLMSKFNNLWVWISKNGEERFKLTFKQIENIAGIPIDHSFLTYKKELPEYGMNRALALKTIRRRPTCSPVPRR